MSFVPKQTPMATRALLSRLGPLLFSTALLPPNALHAQDPCDSVEVVSVSYAPFSETAMQVVLRHTSNQFLSYPHCWLVDQDADTVAREGLTLFGLSGPTESRHYLELDNDTDVPATPFTGTVLFLFSGVEGFNYCALPVTTPLCPAQCMPLQVFVQPQTGNVVTSSFPWSMTDSTGAVVSMGTLNIDADMWQNEDALCLMPGPYTLHIEQPVAAGTGFQVGVMQQGFLSSTPMATLAAGATLDLPFDFYPPCFDRQTGVVERDETPAVITVHYRQLTIKQPDQRALGEVALFDATGRCVARAWANASTLTMDLTSFAPGVHLVRVHNTHTSVQRIVLP